jgi:NitT/TauT family transport system substrate-binding protein
VGLLARPGILRAASPKLTDVTVLFARLAPGPDYSFLWAAQALGYFRQEGLNVTIQPTAGSPEVTRLVAAGQGDIGLPGAEATIMGVSKGLPLKDVFCIQQRMIYSVGAPEKSAIKTIADLKGKRIGVQSLTASPVFVAKALLRKAGLDPDRDVTFIPIGVGARAVAAVTSGQVDATSFHDTQFVLFRAAGVPFRLFPEPSFSRYFTAGVAVKSETVTKRPEVVIGFTRAIAKALVYSFANPAASIEVMDKLLGRKEKSPEVALALLKDRLTYEQLPAEAHGQWGWNTPERYAEFASFLQKVGMIGRPVDGSKIFDGRFLKAANAFDAAAISHSATSARGGQ